MAEAMDPSHLTVPDGRGEHDTLHAVYTCGEEECPVKYVVLVVYEDPQKCVCVCSLWYVLFTLGWCAVVRRCIEGLFDSSRNEH